MTTAEAAARIDAQKWREIADDLATAAREMSSVLPGGADPEHFSFQGAIEAYDAAVEEEGD